MMSAKKGNMAKKIDPFTCSRLQGKNLDGRPESTQSPSRRHREKLNSELEELGKLLPLPDDVRSKLDKLSILRLGVSFFQIENFVSGEKQNTSPRVNDNASFSVLKKFKREGLCLSEAALEALGGFFCIFTSEGEVFFVSENVKIHTGYTQSFLMHQNFLQFIDPDDSMGFRECIAKPKEARIVELDSNGNPRVEGCHHRVCFCNVRCHAGRQSSHVSPFFYKSFRFDGYLRLVNVKSKKLKEYCYFAICVPSHVTSSVGRPPKDLVPYYQIKVGLDYTIKKLDNNGQKYLQYSDKQVANIDAYLLFHPEDIQGMAQMHKHLIESGKCIAVFRALTGKGIWRWVRGSARIVCDKKGKPEFVIASNWMVSDDEGVYYKKQLLESFENEQQAITDGKESPQTDKDTKSESSKEEATKDSKSKPVSTRKSSTRKSNKRKGHGTESDERISSNGISPAQAAVTENRSPQRVLDRKTSSASESSQHSHTSSQSSATSVPSSSPEQSTASESLVSVSSSGPGSSEDVTSPGSFGNESSGEPGTLGLSNGSLPLHHQNGNSSVSPCSSDLSSEGSASAYHIPQEQYINGQQHLADAPVHSIVQERSNLPNAGCVSAPFVPTVNELRPFSTISPPPQLIQSEEMQSMAGPQETRPLQSMIPPMLQAVSSYGENIPSMPLQQTALNLSSMSMPMTTENLQPTTVMPQDVYGMTIPNVRPSVPVPQAAHVSVSSTTQQVYQVPNTIPTHESQNIRPDLQSSSMQQPSQSKKLSHLPRSVDPSVALQQEVNLSDGQLEALKKFLVNWGSKGGIQPFTRNTPAHEIPLEPQLDSITPEKLQLLHSLVNGQGSSAVNPEQRPSVTEGLVSNGLMGQEISQQSGIPQREPVIRSQLFGAEHPARGASYDSFNNPLHDVVQNTQRLRIGTNPDIIPPYTNVPQRVEDHYIHHNSSYPLFNQQPSTLGAYDMRQQPTPHYSSTPATQNYVSCHNFGNQSLNVSNCAPHPSSLVQPGLSPQNISSFSDGTPSFGNAQQQIDLFQSAPKPASNNFTSVGITSNSGGYNYENISTSYDTSSGSGNLLDVIDLHSTKDLFVPPPNVQSSEPLQQQQQQQHLQQHTTQDATDASLGIFEDATVGVHLMPSAGQMEPQLMGSSHYDGLDIPNIPVLEQILESRDVDNLFNHEQSNQKELYQQGNHIAPGNTGGNTFWKPLPQGKQSQTQLLESLLTNGN